jgi:hypothetical protein
MSKTGGILRFVKRPGLRTSGQSEGLTMFWFFLPLLIIFFIAGIVFGTPGRYEFREGSLTKLNKKERERLLKLRL